MSRFTQLLLVFFVVFLSSCKKTYICNCVTTTVYYDNQDKTFYTIVSQGDGTGYSKKLTKKQAKAACKHEEQAVQSSVYNSFTDNGYYKIKNGESVSTSCEVD